MADAPPATIFAVPQELIEQVLVHLAMAGHPRTIAALSDTCRYFHNLIYNSDDHHLWRHIFLTTFDDPRVLLAHLKSANDSGCTLGNLDDKCSSISYPWEIQFKQRISAARAYKICIREGTLCNIDHVRTISSIFSTILPLNNVVLHTHPDHRILAPALSPLSSVPPSDNAIFLLALLGRGLPLAAASEVFKRKDNDLQRLINTQLPLFKLAFYLGLEASVSQMPTPSRYEDKVMEIEERDRLAARSRARQKVYDMRYTTVEQCWGPFVLLTPTGENTERAGHDGSSSPVVHIAINRGNTLRTASHSDSDGEDNEWDGSDDDDSNDGDEDDESPDNRYIYPPAPHRLIPDYSWLSAARFILECNLRRSADLHWAPDHSGTDWGELGGHEFVDALKDVNLVRFGGAPGFWARGWAKNEELESMPTSASDTDGQAEDRRGGEYPGWDWAGVEGRWLRTVSWMGYPDLLHHDRSIARGTDIDLDIEEQVGTFPLTLRITGYLPPPPAPPPNQSQPLSDSDALVYRLPIISIAGDSIGSDQNSSEQRKVTGTVRMIGDGAVRWSMRTRIGASNRTEWVTEGVQIGAIGSAAGVIGLWTGPEHHRTDPLGPWWMWKVSEVPEMA
ncbi:F-box domain-containing protein [Pleurotus pulmonarius]